MQNPLQKAQQLCQQIKAALSDILLLNELTITPHRYSEIELIRRLQKAPYQLLPQYDMADSHALFQVHFLLYHSLYLLKQDASVNQLASIEMGLATISVTPYQSAPAGQALNGHDELQAYYLDLSHLIHTQSQDVEQMLESFWQNIQAPIPDEMELNKACQIFNIEWPVTLSELKPAYKSLCLSHHPDKGGKVTDLQQINWAYRILKSRISV